MLYFGFLKETHTCCYKLLTLSQTIPGFYVPGIEEFSHDAFYPVKDKSYFDV